MRCISVNLLVLMLAGANASVAGPRYERLVVRPNPALVGKSQTAILHIHNETSDTIREVVELNLDGEPHVRQHIALLPGERKALHIQLAITDAGKHQLNTAGLGYGFEILPADSSMEQQELAARRWSRRIIYNNDGGDSVYGQDTRTWLNTSTSGLAGSHVDSIFYSTVGGLTFWHDTRAGQFVDRGIARALIEQGTDVLREQMKFCEEHGMEFFWSMRMNDTHDTVDQWWWLMPQWKRENPELMVGVRGRKYPWGANNWTALDYAQPAVREKIYDIIKDVATRYDVDGIELDFFRGEPFFKNQLIGEPVTDSQREAMTSLIRQLNQLFAFRSKERGRPLLLSVRVPDSLAYARAIGLEVDTWLTEGLIDLIVASGDRRFEPWENIVELGHGHQIPVYACLAGDYLPQDQAGWENIWRGHAVVAWQAGVDGLATFNFLQHKHTLFREMGDPRLLASLEQKYEFTPGTYWGFLKGEKDYIHTVRCSPEPGPFVKTESITLGFAPQPNLPIHYTLDGTTPTIETYRYQQPIRIDADTTLRAAAIYPNQRTSPFMRADYHRAEQIFGPTSGSLPLNFFGEPNRAKKQVAITLPQIPAGLQPRLSLSMMDLDAQQEALFTVNQHGPLKAPETLVSGSMTLADRMDLPKELLVAGENIIEFTFDNMNEGTSGFIVYDCRILFDAN